MDDLPTNEPIIEDGETFAQSYLEAEQPSPFQNDPSKVFSFDNILPSRW